MVVEFTLGIWVVLDRCVISTWSRRYFWVFEVKEEFLYFGTQFTRAKIYRVVVVLPFDFLVRR